MISVVCYGATQAAERAKAYGKSLAETIDLALGELLSEAKMTADAEYAGAITEATVVERPLVLVTKHGEGDYSLTATGREVCFLEFGAGLTAGTPNNPYAVEMPFGVYPGSWSETHERQFTEHGHWYYNGVSYSFIPATRGMFLAAEEMKRNIENGEWLKDRVTGV